MNCYNIKLKKIMHFFVLSIIIGGSLFSLLLVTNHIQYGNRIETYIDTDNYSRYSNKDIIMSASDIIKQELTQENYTLNSFYLKYHIDRFEPGLEFEIELRNMRDDSILQTWNEQGDHIDSDGFKEYIVDSEYSDLEVYLLITANKDNSALYFSDADSLLGAKFYINQEVQSGDLILRLTQVKNVITTIGWGVIFCLFVGCVLASVWYFRVYAYAYEGLKNIIRKIVINRRTYIKDLLVLVAIVMISIIIEVIFSKYNILNFEYNTADSLNEYRCLFVCVLLASVYIFARLKDDFDKKPEIIFLALFVLIGLLYVFVMPAEAEISWDESIHYWRAVNVSHALSGKVNIAESWLYWHSGTGFHLPNSIENLRNMQQQIQVMYDSGIVVSGHSDILGTLYSVAYIPSAIGLIIGRMFHLPYAIVFHMGAAMNLLLFVTLIYMAIKRLYSGKMILVAVSGTLTLMFLASVYSSDSWIAGFTFLGIAYFIGIMQGTKKVSIVDMIVMLGAFTLGFMPKAIYCPLFLIYLFIPYDRFQNKKHLICFRIGILALVLSFMLEAVVNKLVLFLPILFGFVIITYVCYKIQKRLERKQKIVIVSVLVLCIGIGAYAFAYYVLAPVLGQGDLRGGENVNASEQIRFILEHPVKYVMILVNFLTTNYLAFQQALQEIFKTFGYIGDSSLSIVSFVFVWIVAFTDKRDVDLWKNYNKIKIIIVLLSGVIISLIATALYISYTAVGENTIHGCQARYMIPLLFPFFVMIGSNKMKNEMSQKIYNGIVLGVSSLILLVAVWQVVVCFYY